MHEPCGARLESRAAWRAPGSIPDGTRGLRCYAHAPEGARLVPTLRAAMQHPDRYLAAALAEETDASLAAQLGCSPSVVWRLRLAGWPRSDQWAADVGGLAASIHGDPELLGALLRRLGV